MGNIRVESTIGIITSFLFTLGTYFKGYLVVMDPSFCISDKWTSEMTSKCQQIQSSSFPTEIMIMNVFLGFAIGFLVARYMIGFTGTKSVTITSPTFCNNCGKSFGSGELWCGNKQCTEIWREKELSTSC